MKNALISLIALFLLVSFPIAEKISADSVSFDQSYESPEHQSLSNVKHIALACFWYANKHNNILPENLDILVESGFINPKVLISPYAKDKTVPSYKLVLQGNINDFDYSKQSEIILIEEIVCNKNGEHAVSYLDSHAEMVSSYQITK